jgi:predicted permease
MSWLRQLFTRRQIYDDLSEEIRQHLAEKVEYLVAGGMTRKDAEYAAKREFGNVARIEESGHEPWMWPRAESILADIRFALRKLRHSPVFALTAILTLAFGIGANVVVFSVLNGILLRPLDVPHPEDIFRVAGGDNRGDDLSYPDYRDLRDRNQSFTGLLAYKILSISMSLDKSVSQSWGIAASGNYFDVLGLQPALGRFFHASDEHGLGSAPYIVLSYDFWHRQFAGNPGVIGSTVLLSQHPFTIIGIADEDFHGTDYFFSPDYWIPVVNAEQVTGWDDFCCRDHGGFAILGHLKPNVAPRQATENLNALAHQMAKENPKDEGLTLSVRRPGPAGDTHDPMKNALLGITLLAVLVLLAACANLAGIFAARAADRSSELAIRLAIGSSRWMVARQLLAEAVLISLIGGVVGTFLARLLLGALAHWRAGDFPTRFLIAPDARVYLVAITLSVLSGILFAILPARQVWSIDVIQAIKCGYVFAGSFRRFAMRDILLIVQIIVCTLLVTSSLVAVRGMMHLLHVPLGMEPRGVTFAEVNLKAAGVPDAQSRVIQRRLLDAATALPGVTSAATSDNLPFMNGCCWSVYPGTTTQFVPSRVAFGSNVYLVSPGYLQLAGTSLVSGRNFTADDKPGSPAVAIVNETFARQLFGDNTHAIGGRYAMWDKARYEVVGIVEDGKYNSLGEDSQPAMFLAYAQGIGEFIVSSQIYVLVRSQLPQDQITRSLHRALSQIVTTAPIPVLAWSDAIDRSLMLTRTAATVLGVMGLMAAMLAVTGLFGMASYSVSQRIKEQGIRIALGAQRIQVMRAMLGRPIFLLLGGSCIGLIGGVLAARLLAHLISFATIWDPLVLTGVILTMMLLGIVATWIPARRALAIDPARLLRDS